MNSTVFESGDQKLLRIGRVFSSVSGLACARLLAGATHRFSTPSRGAIHDNHLPSGLSLAAVLVGLPKILPRSISGTSAAGDWATAGKILASSKAGRAWRIMETSSFVDGRPIIASWHAGARVGRQMALLGDEMWNSWIEWSRLSMREGQHR